MRKTINDFRSITLFSLLFLFSVTTSSVAGICHFPELTKLPAASTGIDGKAKHLVDILSALRKESPSSETETKIKEKLTATIVEAMGKGEPVKLYIACFPGKSPNHIGKTLGPDVDMAEELAMERLSEIVEQMNKVWPTKLVLASDGRMFADTWWAPNKDVDTYQQGLRKLPKSPHIEVKDLDTYFPGLTPLQARDKIVELYAPSVEEVKASMAENNPNADQRRERTILYQAFIKFMSNDANPLDVAFYQTGTATVNPENPRVILPGKGEKPISRTATDKIIKERAIELMRRSDALNRVLLDHYVKKENYIRLSIREQTETPDKIGIDLLNGHNQADSPTPWHSTIGVLPNGKYLALKRSEAEALGGVLVYKDGKPHHFDLPQDAEKNFAHMVPLVVNNRRFWDKAPTDYIQKLAALRGLGEGQDFAAVVPHIKDALTGTRARLIEIGAGEGRLVDLARAQFPKAQVIAVDNSDTHIGLLKQKYKSDSRVTVLQQNVTDLKIADTDKASVALWMGAGFIELGYGEKFAALKQIKTQLTPDGKLVIDMPAKIPADYPIDAQGRGQISEPFANLLFQHMEEAEVRKLAERAGFTRIQVIEYQSGVGSVRKSYILQP